MCHAAQKKKIIKTIIWFLSGAESFSKYLFTFYAGVLPTLRLFFCWRLAEITGFKGTPGCNFIHVELHSQKTTLCVKEPSLVLCQIISISWSLCFFLFLSIALHSSPCVNECIWQIKWILNLGRNQLRLVQKWKHNVWSRAGRRWWVCDVV